MPNKAYPFRADISCPLGYPNCKVELQYYQEDFPDGPVTWKPWQGCENANGSKSCEQCLAKVLKLTLTEQKSPSVLRDLLL